MKKVFCFFVVFLAVSSAFLCAQAPKLSLSGGAFFANYIDGGGAADFGFLLFNKNSLDIRNHFVLRGAGFDGGGLLSLAEKVSVGMLEEDKFRSYGYIEGGIGIWGDKNKDFLERPLAYTFGGGGGTDIFLREGFSIYFEAGALIYILDNNWKSGGVFQIGWKSYF
ncbi:MAG: hypothetical protein LBD79_09100 [Treponema sp.]|nr:hypothetical protein [Treponema sp.]